MTDVGGSWCNVLPLRPFVCKVTLTETFLSDGYFNCHELHWEIDKAVAMF